MSSPHDLRTYGQRDVAVGQARQFPQQAPHLRDHSKHRAVNTHIVADEIHDDRRMDRTVAPLFQKWFTPCLKGSPDRGKEPRVFAELVKALGEGE